MRLGLATVVVSSYDEAIDFFVGILGFELVEDAALTPTKRWVVVRPPGAETGLLLAQAVGDEQVAAIGRQAGGRVAFFLEVDDVVATHARWSAAGVRFPTPPHHEAYGWVAVFEDVAGNPWDLLTGG